MHNPGKLSWFGDWNDEKSRLSRTRDAGSRILKNEPSLDAKAAPDQKVWVWRWLMMFHIVAEHQSPETRKNTGSLKNRFHIGLC
jgi:hypothetical protein